MKIYKGMDFVAIVHHRAYPIELQDHIWIGKVICHELPHTLEEADKKIAMVKFDEFALCNRPS